jgi:hypothetical protein
MSRLSPTWSTTDERAKKSSVVCTCRRRRGGVASAVSMRRPVPGRPPWRVLGVRCARSGLGHHADRIPSRQVGSDVILTRRVDRAGDTRAGPYSAAGCESGAPAKRGHVRLLRRICRVLRA